MNSCPVCSFSNNPLDDDGELSTEMMRDVLDEIANSTETLTECVWTLETASPDHRVNRQDFCFCALKMNPFALLNGKRLFFEAQNTIRQIQFGIPQRMQS